MSKKKNTIYESISRSVESVIPTDKVFEKVIISLIIRVEDVSISGVGSVIKGCVDYLRGENE